MNEPFFLVSLDEYITLTLEKDTKGQIKPKADWRAIDSPKKRTNDFFLQ